MNASGLGQHPEFLVPPLRLRSGQALSLQNQERQEWGNRGFLSRNDGPAPVENSEDEQAKPDR